MNNTALSGAFDNAPIFRSRLELLHDVWEAKKKEGRSPKWSDFSARDLKAFLPNIALIHRLGSPPRYKVRLMGTGCVRIGGKDYTGCWVDETAHHISRKGIEASYALCLETQEPQFRKVEYIKERSIRAAVYRLFLPCMDSEGAPNIVLVGVYKVEEFGQFYDLAAELADKVSVQEDQTITLI